MKVWHISRFRQRYELPDDVRLNRKGPLIYTKDFVGGGSDDESCGYFRQLMSLRAKPGWLMLLGSFAVLKNIAGNMSMEYRGYLLDSNFKPASVKEIGRWLRVGEKKAGKILAELRDVGLLEYVPVPNFRGPTDRPGRARRKPRKSVKRRKPLKKKTKVKVNGKGKIKKKIKKRQTKSKDKANRVKTHPATTQPIKPHVSAKRGSVIQFPDSSALKLGDVAKQVLHTYSPEAKKFGFEIYRALQLPWNPTSEMGRRELGCFASVWQKAAIPELWDRGIAEAKKIARRKQNRRKGAVWCHVFEKLVAAHQRRKIN